MKGKSAWIISLLLLGECLNLNTAFSQTTSDLLHQAAQLQPPHSAGEALTRMPPGQREDVLNALIIQHFQDVAAAQQAEKQKQQALQATANKNWIQSWADARKNAGDNNNKALVYDLDMAAKGDDYGEYRMGQRYRDAEGVQRDLEKARGWFTKAAAQGLKAAGKELAELPVVVPVVMLTNRDSLATNLPLTNASVLISTKR
jgi:TPR repeat protein